MELHISHILAGIGLFTELVIFGDVLGDMPSIDMPCVDEDVIEMKFELLEMELPYQQINTGWAILIHPRK